MRMNMSMNTITVMGTGTITGMNLIPTITAKARLAPMPLV
jgi:hypothetical protein